MQSEPPKVSIILPSYNYGTYLGTAIDSILSQTFQSFEILAVDDGSCDNSPEILERFQNQNPGRIRVLRHPDGAHRGITETYKLGLAACRGSYAAFLESDDFWHPRNLEVKVAVLDAQPQVGFVYSGYRPFGDPRGSLYWRLYSLSNHLSTPRNIPFDLFKTLLVRNPVASFSHFVARINLMRQIPGSRGMEKNFDWWNLAHLSAVSRAYYLPESLCSWRIHKKSAWYGPSGLRTLAGLLNFLEQLYASLALQEGRFEQNVIRRHLHKTSATLESIKRMLSRRDFGELSVLALKRPVSSSRFAVHLLLKKLLFS